MFTCQRCSHSWESRKDDDKKPLCCPRCKSYSWDVEKIENHIAELRERIGELEAISGSRIISEEDLFEFLKDKNRAIIEQTLKAMVLTGDVFVPKAGFIQLTDDKNCIDKSSILDEKSG